MNTQNLLAKLMVGLLVFLIGSFSIANAQEFALTAGFRSNNADADRTGFTINGRNGLQFGALAFVPITEQIHFRSGFLYTQKYLLSSTGTTTVTETELNLSYLDIPATMMFKFSEYGGVFAGFVLSANQAKDCGSGVSVCTGVQSTILPFTIGASFKFAPQMGGELVYEAYGGKVADGVTNLRSLGANFVVYFE